MPLDNRVLNMTPGEALLDVPMGEIIERMGRAIAEAQVRLDQMSIRIAGMLGDTRLDMRQADGGIVSRSLLELGFTPSFYHFTETDIEIKVTLSIRVDEDFTIRAGVSFGTDTRSTSGTGATGAAGSGGAAPRPAGPSGAAGPSPAGAAGAGAGAISNIFGSGAAALGQEQRASVFGLTVNVEYHRRYGFDTTASSTVKTKMVSVPPPPVFLEALRQSFGLQVNTGG